MSNEQNPRYADTGEVPHDAWPSWCEETTAAHSGRNVEVRQADRALGEVQLGEPQALVAVEYERFGNTETMTIKCGSSVVPVSYVVPAPRTIRQHQDAAGAVDEVTIVDATSRRTIVRFG
jgi:hypothetical protein